MSTFVDVDMTSFITHDHALAFCWYNVRTWWANMQSYYNAVRNLHYRNYKESEKSLNNWTSS